MGLMEPQTNCPISPHSLVKELYEHKKGGKSRNPPFAEHQTKQDQVLGGAPGDIDLPLFLDRVKVEGAKNGAKISSEKPKAVRLY